MKTYLLRNNEQQHQERLALEKWYAKETGDPVDYKTILHKLQRKEYIRISKLPPPKNP